MSDASTEPLESEIRVHNYRGTKIPWFVRAIWLGFWIFAIAYTIRFLIPALQSDLASAIR
jgi:hypothetical protein